MFRAFVFVVFVAGGLLRPDGAFAATSPDGASKFMQGVGNSAIAALRDTRDAMDRREAALRELLRTNFDLDLIGRFALGRFARSATPEQQREYQETFAEYVLKTYSQRLAAYSGETFTVTGTREVTDGDIVVASRIERPTGAPIEAGWRVRGSAGGHKVVDIMLEGVSLLVTHRQEFESVLARSGMSGLLESLRARAQMVGASQALYKKP